MTLKRVHSTLWHETVEKWFFRKVPRRHSCEKQGDMNQGRVLPPPPSLHPAPHIFSKS